MKEPILAQKSAPAEVLLKRYKELYGEDAAGTHKTYFWRKVAYKLQELECGNSTRPEGLAHHYSSLSAKAKNRLKALIEEYDPINNKALRPDNPVINQTAPGKDKRIPPIRAKTGRIEAYTLS